MQNAVAETGEEKKSEKPSYTYFSRECIILPLNERTMKKKRIEEEENKKKREEEEKNQKAEQELAMKMMQLNEIQKKLIQQEKLEKEKKEKRTEEELKELENIQGQFLKMLKNFFNSKTNKEIFLNFEILNKPQLRLLSKAMEFNKSIRSLSINRSNLKDYDIEDLILALENNNYLEKIELNENLLTHKTVANFSNLLLKNSTLKYLSLEGNNLVKNDEDLLNFSDFIGNLKNNSTLIYLNLSKTKLNDECLDIIIESLKYNHTITMIDISFNNNLDYIKVREIQELLKRNKNLYEQERTIEWSERQRLTEQDKRMRELDKEKEILTRVLEDIRTDAENVHKNRDLLIFEERAHAEEEDRRLARRIEKEAIQRATKKKKKVPKK